MTHPTISQKAVEAAARAIYETWAASRSIDDPWDEVSRLGHSIADEARDEAQAALTAALAVDGLVLVNQGALDWLFGEAPDRDGKWFGECEDAMKPFAGKYTRTYWWRSKFRAMLAAAPTGTEG